MELKPGYKETDVGVIPDDWEILKISDITKEISMGPFGSDIKVSNFVKEGVPVLSGKNVQKEKLDDEFHNFVTPEKARSLKKAVAKRGDIVVTHRGTIGQISYIPNYSRYEKYVISQSQFRLHIDQQKSTPEWVVHYFHSDSGSRRLLEKKGHTGVPAIAQATTTFRSLFLPVPPIPEQRAIATALSDVDALLDGLDRLIAKKRDLKQAAMQQLLTGETRLPVFEGDWEVKRLGELFEITSSKRVFQSEWKYEGIPFYRARELAVLGETGRVENELFISKSLYAAFKTAHGVPEPGDMLVTGVGTLGKVYVVKDDNEFYFKDGNIIWFKIHGSVSSEFLRQLFLTKVVMKQITDAAAGTTVGTYTISGAKKTEIPFPSLPEQTAIATVLSDMDAEITALEQRRNKTKELKQAMMQELLTGKTRLI